jgi:hypothetical protein
MKSSPTGSAVHRATYTLELGVWYASCKICGHRVGDANRRRAAGTYREHIKETNGVLGLDLLDEVIDLSTPVAVTPRRVPARS